jgi:hypothetical protein
MLPPDPAAAAFVETGIDFKARSHKVIQLLAW